MKKKISKIPKFKNEEEEARFWSTHDTTEFIDELKPARLTFPKPRKHLISLRMDESTIRTLKKISESKGIGYLTLMRIWIMERLNIEHAKSHHLQNS